MIGSNRMSQYTKCIYTNKKIEYDKTDNKNWRVIAIDDIQCDEILFCEHMVCSMEIFFNF